MTPAERILLDAFADGVNAWIDQLGRSRPLEYLLLGRAPSRWTPLNSLNLLGRMSYTLAYSNLEARHRDAVARLGTPAADALYPVSSPVQEPIQPNGSAVPRFDPLHLPPPAPGVAGDSSAPLSQRPDPGPDAIGSNNWAVARRRTAAGFALLAGDPHLELTLPSIWYEVHLVVPGMMDVYGVTIPGAPSVLIGFTRDIAWTSTNTEADVLDRYDEVVDDRDHPTQYRLDGDWKPLRIEVEQYRDTHGRVIAADTLRYTHRGPLTRAGGSWHSMRWTVLESGRELGAFSAGAKATTTRAFLDSMASYEAPAQNFLVADRGGSIAIRSTGRFPIRPTNRGDELFRGDTSASDWRGQWSVDQMPQAIDPAQGFLASANQQPIDPHTDSRYLGANWPSPWRAIRINELLRADSTVTPDAMRRFQTDPISAAAETFVPALLAAGRKYSAEPEVRRATDLLAEWDLKYTVENTRAVLYENTMREVARLLWDELDSLPTPESAIVAALLADSTSTWWDDHRTSEIEDRDRLLARALASGLAATITARGAPEDGGWRWDRVRHVNIYHLLRIPSLSALGIPVQGGASTLTPVSGRGVHGPSWRMVVELGPEVRGWGTYPGGQSGNPASSRYLSGLARWRDGTLDTLRFPHHAADLGTEERSQLTLQPGGTPQ